MGLYVSKYQNVVEKDINIWIMDLLLGNDMSVVLNTSVPSSFLKEKHNKNVGEEYNEHTDES